MKFSFIPLNIKKKYPLQVSWGLMKENHNLFVTVKRNNVIGIGEMAPGAGTGATTPEEGMDELNRFTASIAADQSIHDIWYRARQEGVSQCALAALDIALWDAHAKELNVPLYRLLGLSSHLVPTSLTVGILTPEVVRERVPEIMARTGTEILKVKLGAAAGIDADQDMFMAVVESARAVNKSVRLRVDANGGWSLGDALIMLPWLKELGVEFVEQPLKKGDEASLPELFKSRALPIYVDESCHLAADIPPLAACVDGIVVKLMKCGGISEALRMVATARAHRLQTMIGCMGESAIGISAGAAIGSLFNYIDLDSFLNLDPDPAIGVTMAGGKLILNDKPGHGATLKSSL